MDSAGRGLTAALKVAAANPAALLEWILVPPQCWNRSEVKCPAGAPDGPSKSPQNIKTQPRVQKPCRARIQRLQNSGTRAGSRRTPGRDPRAFRRAPFAPPVLPCRRRIGMRRPRCVRVLVRAGLLCERHRATAAHSSRCCCPLLASVRRAKSCDVEWKSPARLVGPGRSFSADPLVNRHQRSVVDRAGWKSVSATECAAVEHQLLG